MSASSNLHLWIIALACSIISLTSGYDAGIVTISSNTLQEHFNLSNNSISTVTNAAAFSSILSALLSCYMNHRVSRKLIILLGDILIIIASIVFCSAKQFGVLIVSRVLFGLGQGTSTIASFLFVSEWAPPENRGKLLTLSGVLASTGLSFTFLIRPFLTDKVIPWRILFGATTAFPILHSSIIMFYPDPPIWLGTKGRYTEAESSFEKIYGARVGVKRPLFSKLHAAEGFKRQIQNAKNSIQIKKTIFCNLLVQTVQHVSGFNIVTYILELHDGQDMGLGEQFVLYIIIPFIGVIISLFFVDTQKLGRKGTLLISITSLVVCLAILGCILGPSSELPKQSDKMYVTLGLLSIYSFVYSFGLETIPSIINVEIYDIYFLGVGSGIGCALNWTLALVNSIYYGKFIENAGWRICLGVQAIVSAACTVGIGILMKETRGRDFFE